MLRREWFRPPRHLLALFLAVTVAPASALAWLSWRLLEQDRALENLAASAEFGQSVSGAGLVVESGPEKMEFKQEIFARMDALTPPETVLATNTSGLSITEVAARCARPERVLTAHFWNPPHLMPLVEIVKGARTSEEAAQAVRALLIRCGKAPVLVK